MNEVNKGPWWGHEFPASFPGSAIVLRGGYNLYLALSYNTVQSDTPLGSYLHLGSTSTPAGVISSYQMKVGIEPS